MTATEIPSSPAHKISVVRQPVGWEVREEDGARLVRSVLVTDWHRVERTLHSFAQPNGVLTVDASR